MGLAGAQVALKRSGTQNVLDELNVAEAVRQRANFQQLTQQLFFRRKSLRPWTPPQMWWSVSGRRPKEP